MILYEHWGICLCNTIVQSQEGETLESERGQREGPIEMWRESFPLVQTWIGCVDCHRQTHTHTQKRGRERAAEVVVVDDLLHPDLLLVPLSLFWAAYVDLLLNSCATNRRNCRKGERPSQLAPITTFNADYIVYTGRRAENRRAATSVAHYHQWIALDRPLQLHRRWCSIRSKSNPQHQARWPLGRDVKCCAHWRINRNII